LALLISVLYELLAFLSANWLVGTVNVHSPGASGAAAIALTFLLLAPSSMVAVLLLWVMPTVGDGWTLGIGMALVNVLALTYLIRTYVLTPGKDSPAGSSDARAA